MSDQNSIRYVYEYSGPDTNYTWTEVSREVAAGATTEGRMRDAEYEAVFQGRCRITQPSGATTSYRVRRAV